MIASPVEITHFIEVYQVKHISKAAIRLGITQPALTQSLQRLEEKLKASLFHRTKQGVIPTREAVTFYTHATQLKEYWAEIKNGVATTSNAIEGLFTAGCHPSVGAYTAPRLIRNILQEAPGININFVHDSSRKITERVVSYELDLGYVINPPRHPDLVLKKIGDDKVTFWKKKGLDKPPKKIFADGNRDQVESLLGKTFHKHFADWKLVQTSSLELIRTLTSQGLGIGVLPERVVYAEHRDLVIYDKNLPTKHDEIYLAYRKEVLSSKAGKALLRLASFAL